jgi:hypothetical protein
VKKNIQRFPGAAAQACPREGRDPKGGSDHTGHNDYGILLTSNTMVDIVEGERGKACLEQLL